MVKKSDATSKMTVKNLAEQETPFDPVPYETTDIRTSIALLASAEKEIVIRALNVLAKYADKKDLNVTYLYKNGILSKLLELIVYSDLTILRFVLKILGQIVTLVPEASKELSSEQYNADVKQINHLYMTVTDPIIREFSSQFLSYAVKSSLMASSLLRMGTVVTIFHVLKTCPDPDTQFNTLLHFNNILGAREASYVIPRTPEFSVKIILCFVKNKIPEISDVALKVIETLTNWKCSAIQEFIMAEHGVETLFGLILNEDYRKIHKRCFNVILTCMECRETATYFVKSVEFVQFCEWARTCVKKYILPAATILTALTKHPELRQVLFDFQVEDAILSFFRTENELVFYKTCEGVINMSAHRFCCKKIVTPVVINCLIGMLRRQNVPKKPYHEIALKTICTLMKRNEKTMGLIVACGGLPPIIESSLRDTKEYSEEGNDILMEILYMFSASLEYKEKIMNGEIYRMLLNRFNDPSEHSQKALLILEQYVDIADYRQYFIEFNGPEMVLRKITTTSREQELKNVLIFLQRSFLYKQIGMAFLWKGCVQVLEKINDTIKESVPLINYLLSMMYDLYLPLKFYKLGRLDLTDHFTSRFYLINDLWNAEFPFLEILEEQQVSPNALMYVIDFTADVDELTKKSVLAPGRESSLAVQKNSSKTSKRSSTKKNSSKPSSKASVQIRDSSETISEDKSNIHLNTLACRVPPPINYGFISQDPYLPQYLSKLKTLIYHDKKYILCFQHQVQLVARYVCDLLSGPEDTGTDVMNDHCLEIHLASLKEKLGTSIIPIGFLRYGFYCERALLFKALAEKAGIPCSLVKGRKKGKNNLIYWNEVPIAAEEPYINVDDEQRTYFAYAVVDLIFDVGNLMLVGSMEANRYCGLPDF